MYTYQKKTCLPQNATWHQHQGSCLPEVPRYPLHFQINRKGLSNSNSSAIYHYLKQQQRCMEKSACSKVSLNHTCMGDACLYTMVVVHVHSMDVLTKMAVLEVHTLTRVRADKRSLSQPYGMAVPTCHGLHMLHFGIAPCTSQC